MEQKILPSQGEINYATALETAIEREIKASYIYRTIAKLTTVEHLRAKLEFLAQEEKNHRDNLMDLYRKIAGKTVDFEDRVVFPDTARAKELAGLSVADLLKVAIEKETEANQFYVNLAENATDIAMKEIFNYLAEEELTHRRMLEVEERLYRGKKPLSRPAETMPGIYKEWW